MPNIEQNFGQPINPDQGIEVDGRIYTPEELSELRPILIEIASTIKEKITNVIPADQILPGTNYLDLVKKLIVACSKIKDK